MQLINIIQCTNLGGMEQASLRLMVSLVASGHTCQVLSLNPIGELGHLLEQEQISAIGLPYKGRGGWRSFPRICRELRSSSANALIMTGHNLLAMLALGDTCRGRRVLAMHFHHTGVKPAWQWRLIYRVAVAKFQAITFPSDFIRREAEALYPPVTRIAHTVRNPLNIPALPTPAERINARRALNVPENALLIGNAGWLIPRKRFDIFLQVAARVAATTPQAKFIIAGDGPERPQLEKLAARLGLTERLIWLGWQKDLTAFYQSLDVLLFNADWDAFPTTPLEAMSYGVPVVASVANGGLNEVIDSMSVGILFSQHDIKEMADALSLLLIEAEKRRLMGQAGREKVAAMSKPDLIANWYIDALSGKILPTSKPIL